MTFLYDFLMHIRGVNDPATQRVLARIALNTVYDRTAYPVDLIEVMDLPGFNGPIAWAFLDGCAANPRLRTLNHEKSLPDLMRYANAEVRHA